MDTARFDLTVEIFPRHGELWAYFDYNSDLYEPETIERIQQHYLAILTPCVRTPNRRLLPFLCCPHRSGRNYSSIGTKTEAPIPAVMCFHQQFESHARATPDRLAVMAGEIRLPMESWMNGPIESRNLCSREAQAQRNLWLFAWSAPRIWLPPCWGSPNLEPHTFRWIPHIPLGTNRKYLEDAKPLAVLTTRHLSSELPEEFSASSDANICIEDFDTVRSDAPAFPRASSLRTTSRTSSLPPVRPADPKAWRSPIVHW